MGCVQLGLDEYIEYLQHFYGVHVLLKQRVATFSAESSTSDARVKGSYGSLSQNTMVVLQKVEDLGPRLFGFYNGYCERIGLAGEIPGGLVAKELILRTMITM